MIRYDHPFLRLPLRVDVDQLRREVDQFAPEVWFPDRFQGAVPASYVSIPLVSSRGRENDRMSGPFAATTYLAACPYIRQLIAFFRARVCEVRLRGLGPWSFGQFHFDHDWLFQTRYRIHVPVHTTPLALFYCADRVTHMPAGSVWTFNRTRRHSVFNDDPSVSRVHLIMDLEDSETIRDLVKQSSERSEPAPDDVPIPFVPTESPALDFQEDPVPVVWPPERLKSELAKLGDRFGHARFQAMAPTTEAFLSRWSETWRRYGAAKQGWSTYERLTHRYYAAWNARHPISGPEDDENETNWVGCLLKTGAFSANSHAPQPSWSSKETYGLADTMRIAIATDGAARLSLDGAHWRSIPRMALRALLEIARGATTSDLRKALGRKGFDEAFPSLEQLAEEGSLSVMGGFDRRISFFQMERPARGENAEFYVRPATVARLRTLAPRLRGARIRCTRELHFLLLHNGESAAYVPWAKGYDVLFPEAPGIAQGVALGLGTEEIARELGYAHDDDFLLFVAWLWDLLPFECEDDQDLRKPGVIVRIERGHQVVLPTLAELSPLATVAALREAGGHALVVDSRAHATADSLRIAAIAARISHIDLFVKTSGRAALADVCELPVAGFVLSDCDMSVLRDAERAFRVRGGGRPFVVAALGTIRGVDEMEEIARSPLVDALGVDLRDLATRAGMAGIDAKKTVARAEARARRVAAREGKLLASIGESGPIDRAGRVGGAMILIRGDDQAIVTNGVRAVLPKRPRRAS